MPTQYVRDFFSWRRCAQVAPVATASASASTSATLGRASPLQVVPGPRRALPNTRNVEEGALYQDWVETLVSGRLQDVAAFHARLLVPYEEYPRRPSEAPPALVSAQHGLLALDPPVYDQLMERAVREALTQLTDTPRTRELLDWVLSVPHGDTAHLLAAAHTLLLRARKPGGGGSRDLALHIMRDRAAALPCGASGVHLLRTAILDMDPEVCSLLLARGYLSARETAEERALIAADLRGEGCAQHPFFAWLLRVAPGLRHAAEQK